MFSLEKSIDYITIAAVLLDKDKKIIYGNNIFHDLFNITSDCKITGMFINDDSFKKHIGNSSVLDSINDDTENIHEKYISVLGDDSKRYIRINSLVFKNGTTNYILLFENISNTYNLSYLYQQIFDNTNMGVIICTEENNNYIIKDINSIGCELFDKDKQIILNTNIKNYMCDNNIKIFDNIKDVYNTGVKKEIKKYFCNNKWLNILLIKIESGEIIIMIDDVTFEIETLKKLEKSDKYKTEFLSNMSHEIRSPINSIVGFSELLKEVRGDDNKLNQYIDIIQKSSESLTKIVNDILDITKIEEGKLEINKSNFNINPLMEEIYLTYKDKIKENVQLVLTIPKNDTVILSDVFRLRQIINNLINNANKFTKKGKIEFGYKKKDNNILFFVKDTGIGIKKDEQNAVFERYSQAKNDNKLLGYGLGLSISKELVKLMGGEIWLESEYGKGTNFYFEIPNNREIMKNKNRNNNSEYYNSDFTGKKILIVEDIEFNIRLLESYLENTNAEIIIATDGNDAIFKYNEHKNNLDIILMDIQLPEINGTDVTKIIRTIDKDTPIIAQTAYAMKDDIEGIMSYGFNDIINKPFKKDELLKMIYKYVY